MTILVALLGLIALVVVHELGHMLAAKAVGVRVTEFGVGFGPALFKKRFGKTVYSFRIILLGGFAKMAGMEGVASIEEATEERGPDTYLAKPPWRRAIIIFAGPFANLLAAVLILAVIFMVGVPSLDDATSEVGGTESGTLAAQAGLQQGDRIVSIDGTDIETWQQLQQTVGERRPGDQVDLVADRGGERREFSGALSAKPDDPEKAMVGIRPVLVYTSYGPLEALWQGVESTGRIIGLLGWFVGQLVTGQINFFESVTGPVGIASVSSSAVSQGAFQFAQLLAFISIQLAVVNLLPILPLDGGHLLFIALEKVLGRRVNPETVARIVAFGAALILMLVVFTTYADLSKIFTGQPFIPDKGP